MESQVDWLPAYFHWEAGVSAISASLDNQIRWAIAGSLFKRDKENLQLQCESPTNLFRRSPVIDADAIEFQSAIPVLLVKDLQHSIAFYEQLGFVLIWIEDDEPDYAALVRDNAAIHLSLAAPGQRQPSLQKMSTCEPADVNFMIYGIDNLWQELSDKQIPQLLGPPADQDYGVRDFSIIDPDGYQIRFNEFL